MKTIKNDIIALKNVIFLPIFLIFLLSITGTSCALMLDDSSGGQTAAPTVKNYLKSRAASTAEKVVSSYAPGEVIIKLKEKTEAGGLYTQSYSQRNAAQSSILSELKAKYNLKDERPVFKSLHAQLKAQNLSQAKLDENIQLEAIRKNAALTNKYVSSTVSSREIVDLLPIYVLKTDQDVLATCNRLKQDPGVEYAEPNGIVKVQMVPDDPYYSSSGSWGQSYDDLWGIKKIHCEDAWDVSQGEGVVVAVIDTGVDYNHEDLWDNIWVNPAVVSDRNGDGKIDLNDCDLNGDHIIEPDEIVDNMFGWDFVYGNNDPMDIYGHGTHCSGTIAATGNNGVGVVGVAPMAKIMPIKGLGDDGSGYDSTLADCIRYAADNGADVLSNSWGSTGESQVLTDAFHYADSKGCVSVAAAGNSNMNVKDFFPANIDTVIAVAATNQDDKKCYFSNYGSRIDLSAPGGGYEFGPGGVSDIVNILSTMPDNSYLGMASPDRKVSSGYWRLAGTSMACPHAAGAAAIIKSKYPSDLPNAIRSRLIAGSDSIDGVNGGFEGRLGAGRINTSSSLAAQPEPILKVTAINKSGLIPGESGNIAINVENCWLDASGVVAVLSTDNPKVTIQNGTAALGDIKTGQTATNKESPFNISLAEDIPFGAIINFSLRLTCQNGSDKTYNFSASVTYFVDVGPKTNLPLTDIIPIYATMADYNNDGYADIYYSGWNTGELYKNGGNGAFANVSAKAGVGSVGLPWATLFLDMDNDGDEDLFVSSSSSSGLQNLKLFLNNGDGTFTDITGQSGIPADMVCWMAIAIDYDNDGFLDILTDRGMLRNNGDNTFTKVDLEAIGLPDERSDGPHQMVSLDYDNDNDQDVLITFPFGLYRNNGDGTFTNVTREAGIAGDANCSSLFAVAAGDYNNDGYIDIFLSMFFNEDESMLYSVLYKNNGDGTFSDVTKDAGYVGQNASGFWWGADFFDYDNDGDLDLYVTSQARGLTLIGKNVLYDNDGGMFNNITDIAFPREITPSSAAACIGDYNNDGALDIYAPTGFLGDMGAFLENKIGIKNNWINIKLIGTVSNRDAIGAKVYVKTQAHTQMREVHTSSVQTQPVSFGIGQALSIDEIRVCWPSGAVQILKDSRVNRIVTITESDMSMPAITSVDTVLAQTGSSITIRGKRFGSAQGAGVVRFHEDVTALVQSWSDTEIVCTVPDGTTSGNLYVITDAGRSNGVMFTLMTRPLAPSGLKAAAFFDLYISPYSVRLEWADNSDNETEFRIERSLNPDSGFVQIAVIAPESVTYLDENISKDLQPDTTYYYRVRACNDLGNSEYSNIASVMTGPKAPSNLSAVFVSTTHVDLSWQDNSSNEDGFKIYMGADYGGTKTLVAVVGANIKSYSDRAVTLWPGRRIVYQIYAYNSKGYSGGAYSNAVSINMPPVLTAITPKSVDEAHTLTFTISASDPDGDELTYSSTGLPQGAAFDAATQTFSWTPGYTQAGTYTVTFTVSDGSLTDSGTATITVNDVNHPPEFDLSDQSPLGQIKTAGGYRIVEYDSASLLMIANDHEGDSITMALQNAPPFVTLCYNEAYKVWYLNIRPISGSHGSYENIRLLAWDESHVGAPVSTTFNVYARQRPLICGIGKPSGNVRTYETVNGNTEEEVSYYITASQPDGLRITSWKILKLPEGASVKAIGDSVRYFSWVPTRAQIGIHQEAAMIQVEDETGANALLISTFDIKHANHPPIIQPIGDKTIDESKLLQFTVSAIDPDGDTIILSTGSLPRGATFGKNTFSWTPDYGQAGAYKVTFTASDGALATSQTITITVNGTTPVIASITSQRVASGSGWLVTIEGANFGAAQGNSRFELTGSITYLCVKSWQDTCITCVIPYCDVNGDGIIDAKDEALVRNNQTFKPVNPPSNPYDVNNDRIVNATDVIIVRNNSGRPIPRSGTIKLVTTAGTSNAFDITLKPETPQLSID